MGCAFGRPAPPAQFSVPASASASSIAAAPRGAAPSLPSVGCSQLGRVVGGFSSPPPRPRLSSPCQDRDTVGAPRVSTPSGPPTSLGVDSSHADSTPPPFVFGVKSYCYDSTTPPPLLGVEWSWDDSTPLPSMCQVELS